MTKFTLEEDHNEPVTISVDQVNARFVDETMRGTYEYPPIKLMLTKVRNSQDKKTEEEFTHQVYLHGSRDADTHVSVPITKGLKAGTYILVYQAEFTELNPERKLVVSVYCGQQLEMERVTIEDYPEENFDELDWALYDAFVAQQEDFQDDD